jgi:DNA-binding phage protein
MTNVTRLLPGSRSLVTLTDSMAAKKLVQEEILRSQRTYRHIAHDAQLAASTVGNIGSGKTVWPRLETIIRVLGALGWIITAQRNEGQTK